MKREERTKELARRITNALRECDDFTYEEMACAIAYLVGVVDRISEKANNTKSGTFTKYVFDSCYVIFVQFLKCLQFIVSLCRNITQCGKSKIQQ